MKIDPKTDRERTEFVGKRVGEHVGATAMRLNYTANTVVYGGRTWARTKDPLIKSQQKPASFQRVFRDILAVYRIEGQALGFVCRKARSGAGAADFCVGRVGW